MKKALINNSQKESTMILRKMSKVLSWLGTILILAGPLFASESSTSHLPVGTRMMSRAEHVAIQEMRAAQAEQKTDEEGQPIKEFQTSEIAQEDGEEVAENNQAALISKGIDSEKVARAVYTTSHIGAFHRPTAVTALGDTVEIEDGSIWSVSSSDRYKTLDWLAGDTIIITPNHSWFSSYDFRLINQNTGASVPVVLSLGPVYNGIYTHWITAIDYNANQLCLEDGSVWSISGLDDSVSNKWVINDTVIIGINDGWWSGSRPNILINVNMVNYVRCKCLN